MEEALPLGITKGLGPRRSSKSLHVSASSHKPLLFAFTEIQLVSRTMHRSPDCTWHHTLMSADPGMTVERGLVHGEMLLSCRFKMPSPTSAALEKEHDPAVRGSTDPDHYVVASDTTLPAFAAPETGGTNFRIL